METIQYFRPADRYVFDFECCTVLEGFAQVDTSQDASYFGTWANPEKLQIVSYCEGDVTVQTAGTPEEFVTAVRELKAWNDKHGWEFHGIDGMESQAIIARFEALGLGDLLH